MAMELADVNPFMPTVQIFAVQETDVSRTANVGTVGMNGLRQDGKSILKNYSMMIDPTCLAMITSMMKDRVLLLL